MAMCTPVRQRHLISDSDAPVQYHMRVALLALSPHSHDPPPTVLPGAQHCGPQCRGTVTVSAGLGYRRYHWARRRDQHDGLRVPPTN